MSTTARKGTTRKVAIAALLCLVLAAIIGLGSSTQALAQTDSEYNAMRDDLLNQTDLKGNPTNHGTLSINAAAADENGVINLEVGETATIVLDPYQHLQWHGCRMWSKPCPTVCGNFTDECFVAMYGCMCNTDPSLETIDLTTTVGNLEVISVSDVVKSKEIPVDSDHLSQTNTGTLTITGLKQGTTTITVAADGLYFWWPCTKTYTINVGGGAQGPVVSAVCPAADKGEKATVTASIDTDEAATYRFYYSTDGATWKQAAKNTTGLATVTANPTNAARQWKVVATLADGTTGEASFNVTINDPVVEASTVPAAKYNGKATINVSVSHYGTYGPAKYKYYYSADNGVTWKQVAYHNKQYTDTDSLQVTANGTNAKRMWKVVTTFKDSRTAEAAFTVFIGM